MAALIATILRCPKLSAVKNLKTLRDVGTLINKVGNIELSRQIVELQGETLELIQENYRLKDENRTLKEELSAHNELTFRDNFYWRGDDVQTSQPNPTKCCTTVGNGFMLTNIPGYS